METIAQDTAAEVARLRELVLDLGQAVTRLTAELGDAKARIRALERSAPGARQAQYEADLAAADLAGSGYGEPW